MAGAGREPGPRRGCYPCRVRRFTLITLICLFLLIGAAAVYQMVLASGDRPRYPGPVPGTPLPTSVTGS